LGCHLPGCEVRPLGYSEFARATLQRRAASEIIRPRRGPFPHRSIYVNGDPLDKGLPMSLLLAFLLAQNVDPQPPVRQPGYAEVRSMPVPVVAGDITDRPYRVVGNIETQVRKLTIIEKDPSEARVYRELWERARKLGADAVVNAKYSETLFGGWTWGRRHASGQAIKFLTDSEVATLRRHSSTAAAAAPAPPPSPKKNRAGVTCITCN